MRRPSKATQLLYEVIEDRLGDFGVRDRTPLLDDIVEDYRKAASIRSKEAHVLVAKRLDTVLRLFEDDDWFPSKATEYFVRKYKDTHEHPKTTVEITRCVAGGASGMTTFALHFCESDDCELFMEARCRGFDVSEGLRREQIRRMSGAAESGVLTPDAIEKIARQAEVTPGKDLRKVHRIAGRVQQLRLKTGT